MWFHKDFDFNLALNEAAGYGPMGQSMFGANPYFVYQILPLSTSLSQRGNSKKIKSKPALLVGDIVKGTCIYDKKEHVGTVQRIYIEEGQTKPSYVYIIDRGTHISIPLRASTVKRIWFRGTRGPAHRESHAMVISGLY